MHPECIRSTRNECWTSTFFKARNSGHIKFNLKNFFWSTATYQLTKRSHHMNTLNYLLKSY